MTKIHFIEPMYARSVQALPEGKEWFYEIKFDGYRCLAGKDQKSVMLWSRRGNLYTNQFPIIAQSLQALEPNTLLDGEIVARDESGRISFNLLQRFRSKAEAIEFYVFDLLIYRGKSLLKETLSARRRLLPEALANVATAGSPIHLSETFEIDPAELLHGAKKLGLEGVVAKRRNSVYESGKRSGAWLKYKINHSQEFVVGGYTPGDPFDALIVGYFEKDKLVYVAKVRNGFVPHVRREVALRFKGLKTVDCPFSNLPEKKRTPWALTKEEMKKCQWLKPQLVVQVEFTEWTSDGHLRQSRFAGTREDKNPKEVTREG